jgi:hypothetical protein
MSNDDLIATLDALPPEQRRGRNLFTDAEFEAINRARERGVSWATLHATIDRTPTAKALMHAYAYWLRKQRRPSDA